MSNTIVRRKHTREYVVIPNAIADDEMLSLEAKGLLLYLLAKPNDWVVQITDIQRRCQVGRNKAYDLIKQLCQRGYARRSTDRTSGRITRHIIEIFDFPMREELPLFGSPHPDLPDLKKQDLVKQDIELQDLEIGQHTKDTSLQSPHTDKIPTTTKGASAVVAGDINFDEIQNDFENMWAEWSAAGIQMPEDKQAALNRFMSLPLNLRGTAVNSGNTYRQRMISKGYKQLKLMLWLKSDILHEYDDAPPVNSQGNYIITDDRPEWQSWLDYHCRDAESHSQRVLGNMIVSRQITALERHPPELSDETHPVKWKPVMSFASDWIAYRFSILMTGLERERPKATKFIEKLISDGDENELRTQRSKFCWPTVKAMDEAAADGFGYAIPADFKTPDGLIITEPLPLEADYVKQMIEWADDRLWPPLPINDLLQKVSAAFVDTVRKSS